MVGRRWYMEINILQANARKSVLFRYSLENIRCVKHVKMKNFYELVQLPEIKNQAIATIFLWSKKIS